MDLILLVRDWTGQPVLPKPLIGVRNISWNVPLLAVTGHISAKY